jgi:hypothetical protein
MATARTALFSRKQPGGVYSYANLDQHPGDIYFVDSTNAAASDTAGFGQNPDAPVATIDYAIGLATASKGDVIYVMPGHTESLTAATSMVVDKIGLSIIGLGRGMNRPILDWDDAAGTIELDAASCRLSNLVFRASAATTLKAINVDAHDCEVDNCFFTFEDTGDEFVTTVEIDAFDRFHFHDNLVETESGAGAATRGIYIVDTNDTIIENNIFRGNWTDAVIFGATTLSARMLIKDNVIYNADTGNYNAIDGGALNSTGQIIGNHITSLYSTAAKINSVVRLCNFTWTNNTAVNAVAEGSVGAWSGNATLFPVTTST